MGPWNSPCFLHQRLGVQPGLVAVSPVEEDALLANQDDAAAAVERHTLGQRVRATRHQPAVAPSDLHRWLRAVRREVIYDLRRQRVARRLILAVHSPGRRGCLDARRVLQAPAPSRGDRSGGRTHIAQCAGPPVQPASPVEGMVDRVERHLGAGPRKRSQCRLGGGVSPPLMAAAIAAFSRRDVHSLPEPPRRAPDWSTAVLPGRGMPCGQIGRLVQT